MVGTPFINIFTFLTNFTALKQPQLIFENLKTFEYKKLDQHLQAGLPVSKFFLYFLNIVLHLIDVSETKI